MIIRDKCMELMMLALDDPFKLGLQVKKSRILWYHIGFNVKYRWIKF